MSNSAAMPYEATYGVELEFLVPHASMPVVPVPGNQAQSNTFGLDHIANWLQTTTNFPLAVQCMCTKFDGDNRWAISLPCGNPAPNGHENGEWCVRRDPVNRPYHALKTSLADCYFVQADDVLLPGMTGWSGMEIATPALPSGDVNLPGNASQLRDFLGRLRTWPGTQLGITNRCGLHVHIGEPSRGLTLTVAQRIATLLVLIEAPLLENLVWANRRAVSTYWIPVTPNCDLTAQASGAGPVTVADVAARLPLLFDRGAFWAQNGGFIGPLIKTIWEQRSPEAMSRGFMDAVSGSKCLAGFSIRDRNGRNVLTTKEPHVAKFSTLELRYPEISMDADFIRMWVVIGSRIMAICRSHNKAEYTATLAAVWQVLDFNALGGQPGGINIVDALLGALGLNAEIPEVTRIVTQHAANLDPTLQPHHPARLVRLVR